MAGLSHMKTLFRQWRGFFILAILLFGFRSAIADWYVVPTGSMKPTIIEGDRIFVNKLAYDIKVPFTLVPVARWSGPQRGDIVVFDSPKGNERLVKRVVGLPGDLVELVDNRLFINGRPANYQHVEKDLAGKYWKTDGVERDFFMENIDGKTHLITVIPSRRHLSSDYGPLRVPRDHYFMLGDNRDNSADSRYIGPVHRKFILGKAVSVVLSFKRSDRFFQGLK